MDDVQAYTAVQQHAAFNWFVNAQTSSALGAGRGPCHRLT
jgi:DnaA family protein